MSGVNLMLGDCLDVLRGMADNSVDSIVTDPPAGIAFMGKDWDKDKGGRAGWVAWMTEVAEECLRVIKPGGHALVWAIPRTSHWTGTAWEMAGWQPRDKIYHVFGSGFPKSLDVSKALGKAAGADRPDAIKGGHMGAAGRSHGEDYINAAAALVEKNIPAIVGKGALTRGTPQTDAARQWQGWGTALKPAVEEWWLMRKPLIGTVAENVMAHGTGALNIDGCRVEGEPWKAHSATGLGSVKFFSEGDTPVIEKSPHDGGRWPANLILQNSEEVLAGFPQTTSGKPCGKRNATTGFSSGITSGAADLTCYGDAGSAARFFKQVSPEADDFEAARFIYCAKASKKDRDEGLDGFEQVKVQTKSGGGTPNEGRAASSNGGIRANIHPTVKPTNLMAYLCRLVTPPGGVVLDPFMGSGSTGKAARLEGFGFIGIEREAAYIDIARARIDAATAQAGLFAEMTNV